MKERHRPGKGQTPNLWIHLPFRYNVPWLRVFVVVVVDFLSISVPPADKTHLTMVLSKERSSWAEGAPALFIFSYHLS